MLDGHSYYIKQTEFIGAQRLKRIMIVLLLNLSYTLLALPAVITT